MDIVTSAGSMNIYILKVKDSWETKILLPLSARLTTANASDIGSKINVIRYLISGGRNPIPFKFR